MNAKDRETQYNIYHLLEKLERHQEVQNDHILENVKACASNKTRSKVNTIIMGAMWGVVIAFANRIW